MRLRFLCTVGVYIGCTEHSSCAEGRPIQQPADGAHNSVQQRNQLRWHLQIQVSGHKFSETLRKITPLIE